MKLSKKHGRWPLRSISIPQVSRSSSKKVARIGKRDHITVTIVGNLVRVVPANEASNSSTPLSYTGGKPHIEVATPLKPLGFVPGKRARIPSSGTMATPATNSRSNPNAAETHANGGRLDMAYRF